MAEQVTAEVNGLQRANGTFSASPPGALLRAEECVMPQKGVIEPRPGQSREDTLPTAASIPFGMAEFDGHVLVNYATSKTSTSYGLGYVDGSALNVYSGTYNPVDDDGNDTSYARMKFARASGFLNFCTTTGPKVLEAYNGTPRAAGLLRMPDPIVRMSSAANLGSNGVGLAYGSSRSYRTVLRRILTDGRSLLSPPSGSQTVQNRILAPIGSMVRATNVTTVTLPGTIDPGLDVGDFFDIDPGEANFPAATETVDSVTNNVITYVDIAANATNTVAQDLDTGERPVAVFVSLSADATTETPVRIYRTIDTVTTSPGEEYFLVAEVFPDTADISAGFLSFLDVTPESVINDPLYTNPATGEGLTQANNAPPIYRDVANWGERTWYADTSALQTFRLQMLGVGSPDGVQNNDTLQIDIPGVINSPFLFTFKTSPAAPGEVQIVSNGTPSFNIQKTTEFLIEQIFEVMSGNPADVRAYYDSAANEAPGKLLIQATAYDVPAFNFVASRVESWVPALSIFGDTESSAEHIPDGLTYSKLAQPEAVPLINTLTVGSRNFPIARILGLQQALLICKEGDGIYALTGGFPFSVQQISTANILAPDAACVFADQAWVFTDQGLLRISDSGGAIVVSRSIETDINEQLAQFEDETWDYAFMVPHETQRRLYFFMPFEVKTSLIGAETLPRLRAWTYNNATQAWTGPLYHDVFGGVVSTSANDARTRRLYLGAWDEAWSTTRITCERAGQTPLYKNYLDGAFSTTITAVTTDAQGVQVVKLASATDVAVGDLLSQAAGATSQIAAIRTDLGTGWVECIEERGWQVASCAIGKHFTPSLQFQPSGNPTARKSLTRLSWLFKPGCFASPMSETLLQTDQAQEDLEIETLSLGFGLTPFGVGPFGNPSPLVVDVNPLAAAWTTAAQFFPGFSMPVAWTFFRLQGFSMMLDTASGPTARGR